MLASSRRDCSQSRTQHCCSAAPQSCKEFLPEVVCLKLLFYPYKAGGAEAYAVIRHIGAMHHPLRPFDDHSVLCGTYVVQRVAIRGPSRQQCVHPRHLSRWLHCWAPVYVPHGRAGTTNSRGYRKNLSRKKLRRGIAAPPRRQRVVAGVASAFRWFLGDEIDCRCGSRGCTACGGALGSVRRSARVVSSSVWTECELRRAVVYDQR